MPPVGFEPTIPASEQPQTHVLDRAVTGIGNCQHEQLKTQIEGLLYLLYILRELEHM